MNDKNRALFLDRDGVINEDIQYPHKPEHIVFCKGIFKLCARAAKMGYLIVVVTNQAGIAKGYFTETDVRSLHDWMSEQFRQKEISIAAFYYCPFHREGVVPEYRKDSDCRKPRPGMILQAARDLNIDITRSLMVGDKISDRIELPGLKCLLLKSGYTGENYDIATLDEVAGYLS